MGRKSKLTDKQWAEIEKRLLAGESARSLGKEFGVSESTIRERFSAQHKKIKDVANQLVETEKALKQLPISAQISAHNLASELMAISMHMASAAKHGAMNSDSLNRLATEELKDINTVPHDEKEPKLLRAGILHKLANDAAHIPLNLMRANKDTIDAINGASGANKLPEPAKLDPSGFVDLARQIAGEV